MKTENEIQQEAEKRFPEPNMEDFAYLALLSNGIDEARKLGQRVGATRQAFVDGYNCAATEIQSRVSELERENKSKRETIRLQMIQVNYLQSEKERLEKEVETLRVIIHDLREFGATLPF